MSRAHAEPKVDEQHTATENPADGVRERVEAVLLCADRPLTLGRISEALGLGADVDGPGQVERAIASLNGVYEQTGRSFRIEKVAGGHRVMTLPQYAAEVAALRGARDAGRLSRAAVESLAVVAYRQPITRAELESVRGVSCGEVLRSLLERRLIAIAGRAEEPGRPILYATTKRFLEVFGLSSIKDLPRVEELQLGAPRE